MLSRKLFHYFKRVSSRSTRDRYATERHVPPGYRVLLHAEDVDHQWHLQPRVGLRGEVRLRRIERHDRQVLPLHHRHQLVAGRRPRDGRSADRVRHVVPPQHGDVQQVSVGRAHVVFGFESGRGLLVRGDEDRWGWLGAS